MTTPYQESTALDLITLAMRGAGIIGQGEPAPEDEANDALVILNDMVESWSLEKLFCYSIQRYAFTIATLKQVYTIGPGGDFDAGIAWPSKIESAFVQLPSSGSTSELPMEVVDYDRWSEIVVKGTTSSLGRTVWPDYQFPLGNLSFWPIPNATQTFIFYIRQVLQKLPTLQTTLVYPPGYRRAMRYGLQKELYGAYDREVPQDIVDKASESKATVKRINKRVLYMHCDAALLGTSRAFNWLTGETA